MPHGAAVLSGWHDEIGDTGDRCAWRDGGLKTRIGYTDDGAVDGGI